MVVHPDIEGGDSVDPVLWLTLAIENITDSIVIQSFLVACVGFLYLLLLALFLRLWMLK